MECACQISSGQKEEETFRGEDSWSFSLCQVHCAGERVRKRDRWLGVAAWFPHIHAAAARQSCDWCERGAPTHQHLSIMAELGGDFVLLDC